MPNIAIVGTEGSGKTVFITTLAKRFGTDNALGVFMDPRDRKTVQYVEQVWSTLSNSEWPPSTSPGTLFEFRWAIRWPDELVGDIRMVDCAGQDLRMLFADEQVSSDNIPSHLKHLREYCQSAHIKLLMVNLKDFMGESDQNRRTANEWAIKYALDVWNHNGSAGRVAVVFTQIDQYFDVIQQHGGWKEVVKACLPYVYNAHFRNGSVTTLAVASVYDTEVIADGPSPGAVPAQNFSSRGLEQMVTWIGKQLRSVMHEEEEQKAKEALAAAQAAAAQAAAEKAAQKKKKEEELRLIKKFAVPVLLCLVVGLWLLVRGCGSSSTRPPPPPPPVVPAPEVIDKQDRVFGTGTFEDYGLEVYGHLINNGAPGSVRVFCTVSQAGQSWSQSRVVTLGTGETFFYDFKEPGPTQGNGTPTSDVRVVNEVQ